MKKRILALGLVISLSLSFVACSSGQEKKGHSFLDSNTKDVTQNIKKDVMYNFTDAVYDTEGYDEAKANKILTEFALRLFEENLKDVEHGSDNVLISPTSVITALGMTTYGAKEETLKQIEETLGISRGYLNYHNSEYLRNLPSGLKMANSIWFTNKAHFSVKDEFLHFNKEFYGADIYESAFDEKTLKSINDWVEEKTDGTIKNVLDKISKDAVMYLINALVFEAEWEKEYNEYQMKEDSTFTTSKGESQKVTMMSSEERLYLEDEKAKGVIKYYKGRKYAFAALLPNEGVEMSDYVKSLSGEHLQEMLENPKEAVVHTQIPQFSYEYATEMSEVLKNMGIQDAFDARKADFSNMATSEQGNIFINRVIHKTFIEVSPVGTKAGAATVIEMEYEAEFSPEEQEIKEVNFDRPFLYMIIDCENNMPIFIGTVNSIE